MKTTPPPNFSYDVKIKENGEFDITGVNGAPESPITVTVPDTTITYKLKSGTAPNVVFESPLITNDPDGNLTYEISNDGRTLEITDSDASAEDSICVKLVVKLISPDPQIKNQTVPPKLC